MAVVGMTDAAEPVDPAVAARSISRLRIVVLLAGYVTVGAAACGIFDQFEWAIVVAPVLPTIAAVTLIGRRRSHPGDRRRGSDRRLGHPRGGRQLGRHR